MMVVENFSLFWLPCGFVSSMNIFVTTIVNIHFVIQPGIYGIVMFGFSFIDARIDCCLLQ